MPTITVDDWLAEMRKLGIGEEPDGLTAQEIAEQSGMSINGVREMLRAAIRNERAVCAGRKTVTAIDGRRAQSPVYRFVG